MTPRTAPFETEHRISSRTQGDRIANKPKDLRGLLRWASQQWSLEAPARLHDRDIADDGAPDHTPEAKRYLGLSSKTELPDDWVRVACRVDVDGSFVSPLHCVVSQLDKSERAYVRDLLTDLFTPDAIGDLHSIPSWAQGHVARSVLSQLWDRYRAQPLPRRTVGWVDKSESQRTAEEAA